MDERKRLITILRYLIEHNEEHKEELLRLSESGGEAEDEIKKAALHLADANDHLRKAIKILEGARYEGDKTWEG